MIDISRVMHFTDANPIPKSSFDTFVSSFPAGVSVDSLFDAMNIREIDDFSFETNNPDSNEPMIMTYQEILNSIFKTLP